MNIKVIPMYEKETDLNGIYINTTSRTDIDWQRDLSPFYLGPCPLYWGLSSKIMENGWQYLKVYEEYDNNGEPTEEYFEWASYGWLTNSPIRYPMGKGVIPLYSWWDNKKYSYIEARKNIYVPLYSRAVIKTDGFQKLCELYSKLNSEQTLYLKDFDAYDHRKLGLSLTDVMHKEDKKMGHAFVLMMLLTKDDALKQCKLPS